MLFFQWLVAQKDRADAIGVTAKSVLKDKAFPRRAKRLHVFLIRYEDKPEMRKAIKKAHAEYRRSKKDGAAA